MVAEPTSKELSLAIRRFLVLVDGQGAESDALELAGCLLSLIELAINLKDQPFISFKYPPSDAEYKIVYRKLAERFPMLGMYGSGSASNDVGELPETGDAIDDLADIYRDLIGVVWLIENEQEGAVLWHFRNLFEIHWGRHASELLLNLIVTQKV